MIKNSFTNNTAIDSTGRAEGTMVYIPASGSGLLIYFGGVQYPYGNETAIPVGISIFSCKDNAHKS
jgi:hypothetical protein